MKTLFLGNFGARPGVWEAILAKTAAKLDTTVLFDLDDSQRLIPALAEAEIVVSHIWRKDFPPAPRVKLLQSVAAGIDLIDVPSLPPGVTVCNVAGHEQAIAEYVLMTMLAWQHRLIDIAAAFRGGVWSTGGGAGGGPTHGEIMGKTIGIVGYGKIGREVAKRAVGFGCTVIGANRSPIADKGDAVGNLPARRARPHAAAVRYRRHRGRPGAGDHAAAGRTPVRPDEADGVPDQYRPGWHPR